MVAASRGTGAPPVARRAGGAAALNLCRRQRQSLQDLAVWRFDHPRRQVIGRRWLPLAALQLIVAAEQKVTFTGSLTNGPTAVSGQAFPRMHEGHPGWTIDPGYNPLNSSYGGISSLIPSPALNGNPNIILLHIGTNDLFARDTANMSTRLEALIDKVAENAPSALIVLAQITPRGSTDAALTTSTATSLGIVQSHAARGQHVIGVDMSKLPVPSGLNSDGTHPNDQGTRTWRDWYAAIKDLLPK